MAHGLIKKLVILCLLLLAVVVVDDGLVAGASDGEQFLYSGFAGANLTLGDAAVVTAAGLLQLTNGTVRQKAHAIHPVPFRFHGTPPAAAGTTARSFSASFVFGVLCQDPDACGHGIVLFVAPVNYDFSAAFPSQYIGLVNNRTNGDAAGHIFGVELDTTQNDEFRDIDGNHVGVDINSVISVESSSAGYYAAGEGGGFRNLTLASGEAMQAWVDYDGDGKRINVSLAPLGVAKPARPLISTAYNLSPVLTDAAYVGFSSATGSFNSRHYILGWSFAMNGPAPAIDAAKLPKLPRFSPKHRSMVAAVIISPIAAILVVAAIAVVLILRWRNYSELREDWELEFGPHRFSYKDLFRATDGFKKKNLLGVGGFGSVYKGVLPGSKSEVAVKRVSHESKQGMKEFIAEVVSMGRLQHRNLVQLLGYCRRKGELLLVYEYMPNRSLDKHLYGEDDQILEWDQRFRIIRGIASGLLYLHEEWEKVIIHRDVKASNVLLDGEMNGRLGDFGLARLYDHGNDPQSTHVVGTIGYLAPELGRSSKVSPLTDVFAFGIFVLEVTCGQRPIQQNSQGDQMVLVDWVVENQLRGSLTETVDSRLNGNYDASEACIALQLGLMCSHPLSNARPTMRQVVKYFNGDIPLPELTSTHDQSFGTLALMQNQGFDSYIMSYPSSITTMTTLLGER